MTAWIAFAAWPVLACLLWRRAGPLRASFLVLFAGWAFLPVSPPLPATVHSMPGVGLPSFTWITKASVIGFSLLLGLAVFERRRLRLTRPRWFDLPAVLWCLAPLVSGLASHQPWLGRTLPATLYQTLAWGGPWLTGRVCLAEPGALGEWTRHLERLGLAYLPFVIPEICFGPFWYAWIYGPHSYTGVGAGRYLGYRPMVFMENGNQLGMWMAVVSLAAFGRWLAGEERGRWKRWSPPLVLVLATLSCQSVGSILLLLAGMALLPVFRSRAGRLALLAVCVLPVAWVGLRLSGAMDVRRLAQTTEIGREAKEALKELGRGSFGWRLKQEEVHLDRALAHPALGWGRTRWYEGKGADRPWGFWMIALGAYGGAGLLYLLGVLLLPAIGWMGKGRPDRMGAVWLVILLAVVGDSLLNSTILVPVIASAGGLVSARRGRAPRPPDEPATDSPAGFSRNRQSARRQAPYR